MRTVTVSLIVMAGMAAPAALRAETLEEVEKKIVELTSKHKSVEMKMKTKLDVSNEQMTEKSESDSHVIYARKGDKWLLRNETTSKGSRKITGGDEEKFNMKMVHVYDGEYTYTLTETPEFKQATKSKTEGQNYFGEELWKEMRKHVDLKLLPDDTVDGKSTWVIESRPKPQADATPEQQAELKRTRSVSYYRKSDGAAVKVVTYQDDKPTVTMTLVDVKYDFEPRPDTFKFTPPEGVTVMDLDALASGQGQDGSAGNSDAPSEPAQETKTDAGDSSAQAKKEEPKPAPKEEKKERGLGGLLKKLR